MRNRLLLFVGVSAAGGPIAETLSRPVDAVVASTTVEATVAETLSRPVDAVSVTAGEAGATLVETLPRPVDCIDVSATDDTTVTGWQIRAVTDVGTPIGFLPLNVERVRRQRNALETVECSLNTEEPAGKLVDLFGYELQFWLDGELHAWTRPAEVDAEPVNSRIVLYGLFSYLYDVHVGGELPNHIVNVNEDSAPVGSTPVSWSWTSNIEDLAIVENNVELWDVAKALQLNNSEAGQNAYAWQRIPVPADLVGVEFVATAVVYVADNKGGAPAYGGAAVDNRGLVLARTDSAGEVLEDLQISAAISNDTPRNEKVRLQTPPVLGVSGEYLEVRLYAPDAFTAWRWVKVTDGRAVSVDRVDKTRAVQVLMEHGQDVTVDMQDHRIGTDITECGETFSGSWPWYRRENIGEKIQDLMNTIECEMVLTSTTRTLRVAPTVGRVLTAVLDKDDLTTWALGRALSTSASRVIRKGEGSGIGQDEWWADGGMPWLRESVDFAPPGESIAQGRDEATDAVNRRKNRPVLPRFEVKGSVAVEVRPHDKLSLTIDHGAGQTLGQVRVLSVDFDGSRRAAMIEAEPV